VRQTDKKDKLQRNSTNLAH